MAENLSAIPWVATPRSPGVSWRPRSPAPGTPSARLGRSAGGCPALLLFHGRLAPRQASIWKRYAYLWVTLILFLVSLAGHWWLGWSAYVSEQQLHGATPQVGDYLVQAGRDTLENWQSEFLQLIWQVAGLALLLHVGSPQSREEDDRLEEKLDAILRAVNTKDGERIIAELDERFDRGKPSA